MKILVIGGGGREHALVWRLRQSEQVEKLWCAPGNGGIAEDAECISVNASDVEGLAALAERLQADLTVAGPEAPLVGGIRDVFERRGMRLIGPSAHHARLEGSKIHAKQFMQRHGIPTARSYGAFDSSAEAIAALGRVEWPVVVKADGLCAGKGVLVAETRAQAERFIRRVLDEKDLGEGGSRILLEEALVGEELSFIVLTDGRSTLEMMPTQDHKRAFDGDRGPNTGGMGAYSADGIASPAMTALIREKIVQPTIRGLANEGLAEGETPYRGFLYCGLMLTDSGPMVLEYNCRLGDPETQPLAMRMDFDLAGALAATAAGKLDEFQPTWIPGASACVVMASGGYPGAFETGRKITGLEDAKAMSGIAVFHAGTRREDGAAVTNGGRVLGVTAAAASLEEAIAKAYAAVRKIHFEGAHYRTDIGAKGMAKVCAAGEKIRG